MSLMIISKIKCAGYFENRQHFFKEISFTLSILCKLVKDYRRILNLGNIMEWYKIYINVMIYGEVKKQAI